MENDMYRFLGQLRSHVKLMIAQGVSNELVIPEIPYHHLVFNPAKTINQVMKHCADVFNAVTLLGKASKIYGAQVQVLAQHKHCQLPPTIGGKIVLFMAVDDTLLHMLPH